MRDAAVKAEAIEGQEDEGLSAAGSRRSGRARTQAASFDPSPPKPASEGKPSIKRKAFFMSKEEKAKLAEELAEIEAQQAAVRAREEEEARKMRSIAMQETLRREKELLRQDNLRVSEGKSVNSLFLKAAAGPKATTEDDALSAEMAAIAAAFGATQARLEQSPTLDVFPAIIGVGYVARSDSHTLAVPWPLKADATKQSLSELADAIMVPTDGILACTTGVNKATEQRHFCRDPDLTVHDVAAGIKILAQLTSSRTSDVETLVHRLVTRWDEGSGAELWAHLARPTCSEHVCSNRPGVALLLSTLKDLVRGPNSSKAGVGDARDKRRKKAKRSPWGSVSDGGDDGSDASEVDGVDAYSESSDEDSSDDDFQDDVGGLARSLKRGRARALKKLCPLQPPICHGIIVVGPSGSGKSAAIAACCEELSLQVLEINPSDRRSGKMVQDTVGEATRSSCVGTTNTTCSCILIRGAGCVCERTFVWIQTRLMLRHCRRRKAISW